MKLRHVAAALDVDPSSVSRWERGGQIRDDDHKLALAALYGVSVEYMLAWDLREAAA